jgi:hypothetical protein
LRRWGDDTSLYEGIDKRRLAVIIKLSYFSKFVNLPIDKIEYIVLKLKVKEALA